VTTATAPTSSQDRCVLLRGISWQTYESLLNELQAEGQHLRLTYDQGLLEIMSPSPWHGKAGLLIARLVEIYTLEKQIPLVGLGNTTWRRESLAKGIEADECYYIQNAAWAAGREEFDLAVDPPPDLAIEIDITSSSLDKQSIYAALGVPELWRFENEKLIILQLSHSGIYEAAPVSLFLPALTPAVIERTVEERTSSKTDTQIMADFVKWVQSQSA
jgi:Uma2 family endonuclease